MPAIIGLIIIVAILVWLYRAQMKSFADCASILGMPQATTRSETKGTTAEGFYFHQSLLLKGSIEGMSAEVYIRNVRRSKVRNSRQSGSQFTVLALFPSHPPAAAFRLQPVGMMGVIETLQQGAPTALPTGDSDFDAAFHLYTSDARGALAALSPNLRRDLLAFRQTVAGVLTDSLASKMASAFLLGSIDVEPHLVRYSMPGSPSAKIAEHLKLVAPLLARLGNFPGRA